MDSLIFSSSNLIKRWPLWTLAPCSITSSISNSDQTSGRRATSSILRATNVPSSGTTTLKRLASTLSVLRFLTSGLAAGFLSSLAAGFSSGLAVLSLSFASAGFFFFFFSAFGFGFGVFFFFLLFGFGLRLVSVFGGRFFLFRLGRIAFG